MQIFFNIKKLEEVLIELHCLTGVKVSLIYNYDRTVATVPSISCRLCETKRKDEAFYKKCRECDILACKMADEITEPYIYQCHFGLHEAVSAVRVQNKIVGYLMIGQMLSDRENVIEKNNLSQEEIEMLDELPFLSVEKINSAIKLFNWLGQYLVYSADIAFTYNITVQNIVEYIQQKLEEPITVADLCKKFCVSRTLLYNLFLKELKMGVREYIILLRLEKSKSLLKANSVEKTSELVGMQNNYFIRLFKKKFGLTPSKFKKQMK